MNLQERFEEALAACPVVGIFRWHECGAVLTATAEALWRGGLRLVEITLNTPGALGAVSELQRRDRPSGAMIGVGTVTSVEEAERAMSAGAEFLVTPIVDEATIRFAAGEGVPILVGAMTPTEGLAASRAGATAVKVFPIDQLGPGYVANVLAPLDGLRLIPTGGITLAELPDYFAAGAVAVGVGPTMIDPAAVEAGDWDAVVAEAERWVSAISDTKSGG
ncbi:MAG: bifunctional 4-hydroxy-2-oxoglutarate aldolase/2-dehydro-3-deoxy-phosphogluconate aldolase [Planctomycetota bacterium]